MFMSSSMKAAIHLGPNYLANLEVYNNTNFQEIQSLFNITQKLILEHSEDILNVNNDWKRISLMDEIDIGSWSSNPVDKGRSACILRFRTVCGRCMITEMQL